MLLLTEGMQPRLFGLDFQLIADSIEIRTQSDTVDAADLGNVTDMIDAALDRGIDLILIFAKSGTEVDSRHAASFG